MKKVLLTLLIIIGTNFLHAQEWGTSNFRFSGIGSDLTVKKLIIIPSQILLLLFGNEAGMGYGVETKQYGDNNRSFEISTGFRRNKISFGLTSGFTAKTESWNARLGYQVLGNQRLSKFKGRLGVISMHKAQGIFFESLFEKDDMGITLQAAQLFDRDAKIIIPYLSIGLQFKYKGIAHNKTKKISSNN